MKKLTDEVVADALGWTKVWNRKNAHGTEQLSGLRPDGSKTPCSVPAFTTSLDAIVGEIEARGLWHKSGHGIVIGGGLKNERAYFAQIGGTEAVYARTQALALCAALRASQAAKSKGRK